jgi:3-oxoacyl-(acyl-carrier-protein) synthase
MLHVLNNMATSSISIKYKFQGPSGTTASACATSAASIGEGMRNIQFSDVYHMDLIL